MSGRNAERAARAGTSAMPARISRDPWSAAPRLTGAVAPSSRALARAMAAAGRSVAATGLVVELGPGTGPVTQGADRARDRPAAAGARRIQSDLLPSARERFAPARIVEGDAYDLPRTLHAFAAEPVSAVVSSLPLLVQPPPRRQRLLDDAFALMGSQGAFVQFTYGPVLADSAEASRRALHRSPQPADLAEPAAGQGLDLPARPGAASTRRPCVRRSRPATG